MRDLPDDIFLHQSGDDGSFLERLVRSSFKARNLDFIEPSTNIPLWTEKQHGLDRVRAWNDLPVDRREVTLHSLSQGLMAEAFFIEQAGMAYAAKMNLLARSIEERTFFCFMAEEEATHFHRLGPWFPSWAKESSADSFSSLIAEIVAVADRRDSLILIQVLLEGWGLAHYQSLSEGTSCAVLASILRDIVQDETRHHAAGVILSTRTVPHRDDFLRDALERLLQMVRIGPAAVLGSLAAAHGGLSQNQLAQSWAELGATESTNERLDRIRRLLEKVMSPDFLLRYERGGLFSAMTPEDSLRALGL